MINYTKLRLFLSLLTDYLHPTIKSKFILFDPWNEFACKLLSAIAENHEIAEISIYMCG